MKNISIVILLSVLISGCGNNIVFNESKPMDNDSWNRFDDLKFEFYVEEDIPYDLLLSINHTNEANSTVFVTISIETPGGEFRAKDYQFKLKNRQNEWLGELEDDKYKIELPVKKEFVFDKKGNCKVTIENRYSKIQLPGISAVGFLVKKSD